MEEPHQIRLRGAALLLVALIPSWTADVNAEDRGRAVAELLPQFASQIPEAGCSTEGGYAECLGGDCREVLSTATNKCIGEIQPQLPEYVRTHASAVGIGGQIGNCAAEKIAAAHKQAFQRSAGCRDLFARLELRADQRQALRAGSKQLAAKICSKEAISQGCYDNTDDCVAGLSVHEAQCSKKYLAEFPVQWIGERETSEWLEKIVSCIGRTLYDERVERGFAAEGRCITALSDLAKSK